VPQSRTEGKSIETATRGTEQWLEKRSNDAPGLWHSHNTDVW
jgi:hypothetical protein